MDGGPPVCVLNFSIYWAVPTLFLFIYLSACLFIFVYFWRTSRNLEILSCLSKNTKLRKTDATRSKEPCSFNMCIWRHATNFKERKKNLSERNDPSSMRKKLFPFVGYISNPKSSVGGMRVSSAQGTWKVESKIQQEPDLWGRNSSNSDVLTLVPSPCLKFPLGLKQPALPCL